MADVFTKTKRSQVMSCIRGRSNKGTELYFVKIFKKHNIKGWRRNRPVFGKPDFVFPALRIALFVDGCFWHGCPKHYSAPTTNVEFWNKKLCVNKNRDLVVNRTLRNRAWYVMRVWEHDLRKTTENTIIKRIKRAIKRQGGH